MPVQRLLTIWLLLLALGLPLPGATSGSWHCPDGTPCVAAPSGRYQCAGGACRLPCCRKAGAGCHGLCRHGALPGLDAGPIPGENGQPGITCTCQFTPAARIAASAAAFPQPHGFGIDTVTAVLPLDQPLQCERQPVGYVPTSDPSPPAPPGIPSLGPRAPPAV